MRANKFAFAFGIFALIMGIVIDIVALFSGWASQISTEEALVGSIVILIGLAFLSIARPIYRWLFLAVVFCGFLYYFYFQSRQIITALLISLLIVGVSEYGLRHR